MNGRSWTPEEDALVRAAVGNRRTRTSVGWVCSSSLPATSFAVATSLTA